MSKVSIEKTVENLAKRVRDLEDKISEISEFDTLTDEEKYRGIETKKWIESSDTSKLAKIK